MLYLVATPIGNLEDITLRALRVLREVDYILAEDTRHTLKLLNHYEIKKKLISFHKFNEKSRHEEILADLKGGKKIALVSDAGTPLIADPGREIVHIAKMHQIEVTSLPGASAPIVAYSASGLTSDQFQFLGFFPEKASLRKKAIENAESYPGVTIFFESPYRLLKTIDEFHADTLLTVAKELTKIHEEIITGTKEMLLSHFKDKQVKGEFVILIQGKKPSANLFLPFEKELLEILSNTVPKSTAAKILSKLTGKSKKNFYCT